MAGATLWAALTAVGVTLLVIKEFVGFDIAKAILWRVAALFLAAAGTVGAVGWLGRWSRDTITWGVHLGQNASKDAVGAAALIGIVIGLVTLVWLAAVLIPNNWFAVKLNDVASLFGLILPSLAVTIPGPVGEWLRTGVWPALAQPMIDGVSQMFGG